MTTTTTTNNTTTNNTTKEPIMAKSTTTEKVQLIQNYLSIHSDKVSSLNCKLTRLNLCECTYVEILFDTVAVTGKSSTGRHIVHIPLTNTQFSAMYRSMLAKNEDFALFVEAQNTDNNNNTTKENNMPYTSEQIKFMEEQATNYADYIVREGGSARVLKVTKKFDTLEDMHTSPEFKAVFEGFQGMDDEIRMDKNPEFKFHSAVVVDGTIYKTYTIVKEGLMVFKPVTLGSMIHSGAFSEVFDMGAYIVIVHHNWANTSKNRKIFVQAGKTVTNDF